MVTNALRAARFFWLVGLHPLYALVIVFLVTAIGIVTLWFDSKEVDSGLGMILFAQMYLASSGFIPRARQGHFDPVLTGDVSRVSVLISHWIVSIAPGLAAWLAIVFTALVAGSPAAASAIAGPRAAGLIIVCTLAWSIGFELPRGAAGMLWMALLVVVVSLRADLVPSASPLTLLLCPFLLLGSRTTIPVDHVAAALLLSCVPLLATWRMADRLDLYLMDRV